MTEATATESALRARADLASAHAGVNAAAFELRAARGQAQPSIAVNADYGGGGDRASFNQVYTVGASVSIPLYTGGTIGADVAHAESELARRQAECDDLKGQVVYDVHVAWLDLTAASASLSVAESANTLACRALKQARDRYANGVTNYLEVVQAQEAVAQAGENVVASVYAVNLAKLTIARAMGGADVRVKGWMRP
jgi:outer membrane protein TolC